jgi:hypothetical protein
MPPWPFRSVSPGFPPRGGSNTLLVIDLDVVAGVFAKQDPVTHLHVERDTMALFNLAGPDGYYFALLRLFFGRIGDDDPALPGFFLFQPAYEDTVMQGSYVQSFL